MLVFFKGAVKANLTPLYVKEDLVNLGMYLSFFPFLLFNFNRKKKERKM